MGLNIPMTQLIEVISIGTGDPGLLTQEAATALRSVDVFLLADKGGAKRELVETRRRLVEQVVGTKGYRFIEVPDPERGPDAERNDVDYQAGVRDWHAERVEAYGQILDQLPPFTVIGFLVWGDPAFYDSTLRIIDSLQERARHLGKTEFSVRVLPCISTPQLLAARHQIALNRIGSPIHITTGRRLAAEYHPGLGDVVVMLDGHLSCRELVEEYPDLTIYWGAYLGGAHEVLRSGRLADVIDELVDLRAALRTEHGWLMDTYLLRP